MTYFMVEISLHCIRKYQDINWAQTLLFKPVVTISNTLFQQSKNLFLPIQVQGIREWYQIRLSWKTSYLLIVQLCVQHRKDSQAFRNYDSS